MRASVPHLAGFGYLKNWFVSYLPELYAIVWDKNDPMSVLGSQNTYLCTN